MEYTIAKLAQLSGVTARTLRYYDQIGLLCPARVSNGYRIYGEAEVDRLQQILFYRTLGVELKEIGAIMKAPSFDRAAALEAHLSALLQKREELELLIGNVSKTIRTLKGETAMSDQEKFEGLKEKMLSDHEAKYGKEIRGRYGDGTVNASYAKVKGMTREKMRAAEELRVNIEETLREAFAQGDPAGEPAQRACALHREWLCLFWPDGLYSKEAHKGLADLYVADERFKANYEKIAPGCTEFFRKAIYIYCGE